MTHQLLFAGFGGQGILLMGQLIAYAGMIENKKVSWIPSYGPVMRGGTANCSVIISDKLIGSPFILKPTTVVAMNRPSLDKFEPMIMAGGNLVINSSLADREAKRTDITTLSVPSTEIAVEMGDVRAANMVIIGAVAALTKAVNEDSLIAAIGKKFTKPEILKLNIEAIRRGAACMKR